jgi:bifunctional enzyme CysN/CysC
VSIELEDDIDTSRGDMICRPHNQPSVTQEFDAMVCWMNDRQLEEGKRYFIKHTTRTGRAIIDQLRYRIDVNTLHRDEAATSLGLNEIGRVHLRTSTPLMVDEYRLNRSTGSFILIDETTNDTVGAGMIVDPGTGGASLVDELADDHSDESAAA